MSDTLLSELQDDRKRYINMINSMLAKLEAYSTKLGSRDCKGTEAQQRGCLDMAIHFLGNAKECLK